MEAVTIAAATKIGQKAIDALFSMAEGPILTWWKERKNKDIARSLAQRIKIVDRVKTLLHTEKEVSLSSIYYPSKIQMDGGQPSTRVDQISEFWGSYNYIIEGTVGQGKSFLLRYLCITQMRKAEERIPIFLELRFLRTAESFQSFVFEGFRNHGFHIDDEFFSFYAKSGRFVLLLDAFDEVPQLAVTDTVNAIQKYTERYPEFQIIVTSRPNSALHPSAAFRVLKLDLLSDVDHQPYLQRLLKDEKRANQIADAINASPQMQGLLKTPLLLTLLALVYNTYQSVPVNETEFYGLLFHVVFFRHDSSKPGLQRSRYTKLGERELQELFEAFCFFTKQVKRVVLTVDDFYMAIRQAKEKTGAVVDDNDFKNEIVKVACLLQEEGNRLQFIHKSVQEFYAAGFLLHSPEAVARKFYGAMIDGRWWNWQQELRFLEIIDPYRYSLYFVRPQLAKMPSELPLQSADGFALLASEETVRRIFDEATVQLYLPRSIAEGRLDRDAEEIASWHPMQSITTATILNEDGAVRVSFFYEKVRENAIKKLLHFLGGENDTETKRRLFRFMSGPMPIEAVGRGVKPTITMGAVELFEKLKMLDDARRLANMALHELSEIWQSAEETIKVYKSREEIDFL